MKSRLIKWTIFLFVLSTSLWLCYKRVDKLCQEYLNNPLTYDLMKEQVGALTEGAALPRGEWSYGIDISHHQPIVRWNKLKILLDEDGRTVWRLEEAVRTETIDFVFMKAKLMLIMIIRSSLKASIMETIMYPVLNLWLCRKNLIISL